MNVLVVTFDSNLTWSDQVSDAIKKTNKALSALILIKVI
jgi:hypothetical protein